MGRSTARELRLNYLLSSLRTADLELLTPFFKGVELRRGNVLGIPNKPIGHVYFPTSGIVSVASVSARTWQVEVAMIGREGMTGVSELFGENRSPNSTYVQISGHGQRIEVQDLRALANASVSLRNCLLSFAQALMVQTTYTVLASARGRTTERLARWLLMAHDRLNGNNIPLFHVGLAQILSVPRTGVTMALNRLEGRKLVGLRRGVVSIRNRAGLEKIANGLYGIPEEEYRRLIGTVGTNR